MPDPDMAPRQDDDDAFTRAELDEALGHAWLAARAARHAGDLPLARRHMDFIDTLLEKRSRAST
jgi:hypothetical protein